MLHAMLRGAVSETMLLRSISPSPKLLLHVQLAQRSCRSQRLWHRCETIVGQVQRREMPQPCSVRGRLSKAAQTFAI
jgi:hypothetical protein